MSFSLPNLRYATSSGTITVPSNETWLVKEVAGPIITYTINSNTYQKQWFNTAVPAEIPTFTFNNLPRYAGKIGSGLLLHTGDSINFNSATGYIYYYILETDFNYNMTIPGLRQAAITALSSITVPSNETWIVKLCIGGCTQTTLSGANITITASINSNSIPLLYIPLPSSITSINYYENCVNNTLIMKTGDSFTLASTYPTGVAAPVLQVAYWIRETDFNF